PVPLLQNKGQDWILWNLQISGPILFHYPNYYQNLQSSVYYLIYLGPLFRQFLKLLLVTSSIKTKQAFQQKLFKIRLSSPMPMPMWIPVEYIQIQLKCWP